MTVRIAGDVCLSQSQDNDERPSASPDDDHASSNTGQASPVAQEASHAAEQASSEAKEASHAVMQASLVTKEASHVAEQASPTMVQACPATGQATSSAELTPRRAGDGTASWPQASARAPPQCGIAVRTSAPPLGRTPQRTVRQRQKGWIQPMPKFPRREPDIARLAQDVVTGFAAHQEDFPVPPVSPDEMQQALVEYNAAREAAIVASAHAVSGTQAKDEALAKLVDALKTDLRYAENTVKGHDGKLQLIGWGARRSRTANEMPGQVRTLELIREGTDWIILGWKQPTDGGLVAAYKIQRRQRKGGDWIDVGMAVESEIMLTGQESGMEFEYHVVAVNKLGEGPPSNNVRAVL